MQYSKGYICDALCDLVPFVQFKKCEKHLWKSVIFDTHNHERDYFKTKWIRKIHKHFVQCNKQNIHVTKTDNFLWFYATRWNLFNFRNKRGWLTFSCMILRNGQTYAKYLAVFVLQKLWTIFDHLLSYMKGLNSE